MRRRATPLALVAIGLAAALVASGTAAVGDVARGGGVQLTLPDGWAKVVSRDTRVDDPVCSLQITITWSASRIRWRAPSPATSAPTTRSEPPSTAKPDDGRRD